MTLLTIPFDVTTDLEMPDELAGQTTKQDACDMVAITAHICGMML